MMIYLQKTAKNLPSIRDERFFPWYHPDFRSLAVLGGPEETRTPDLLHAMEALYQLRYKPISSMLTGYATDQNLLLSIRDNGRSDKCYSQTSHLWLTGEFSLPLQSRTNRLLSDVR
jgi:hypothetical protein